MSTTTATTTSTTNANKKSTIETMDAKGKSVDDKVKKFEWVMDLLEGKFSWSFDLSKKKCKKYGHTDRKLLVTSKWVISSIEFLDTIETIKNRIYFPIKVTTIDGKSWIINRRYSYFTTLEYNIKLRNNKNLLPNVTNKLPPKDLNSKSVALVSLKDDDIKKRMNLLNLYIQDLLLIANQKEGNSDLTEAIRRLRSELNYFVEVKINTDVTEVVELCTGCNEYLQLDTTTNQCCVECGTKQIK